MSRLKFLLISKLDNDELLSLINRGLYDNSRGTVYAVCDVLATRPKVDVLIKSMAANYNKIAIDRLYKTFTLDLWIYYIKYHVYYIMPDHVRYMPDEVKELYKDSHIHTFYAIMNNESKKNIEAARYVDYLLSVSSKG